MWPCLSNSRSRSLAMATRSARRPLVAAFISTSL
eukprot:CAMPEP_0181272396 /NCGR_PEP_ID=MMETSP1097-20121128/7982_1 /TAXON_ID=35684 /ORGANISM="Pseudopedinella elastica, Strain CCMP716" /LENGTH=33 /DNA_ID= /DNA_START= /DNA_END= /DNA_ORIENTATION=